MFTKEFWKEVFWGGGVINIVFLMWFLLAVLAFDFHPLSIIIGWYIGRTIGVAIFMPHKYKNM